MKYNKMKWKKQIKCLLWAVPTEGSRNNQNVRLRASHCAALSDLGWPVCLEWSNNVMVTKWPLSQRGNTSSRLIWPKCLPSGGRSWAAPLTAELRWRGGTHDGTHLHVDDFKGPDGEHQAVDHFVRLWSKSSWETRRRDSSKHNDVTSTATCFYFRGDVSLNGKWPFQIW